MFGLDVFDQALGELGARALFERDLRLHDCSAFTSSICLSMLRRRRVAPATSTPLHDRIAVDRFDRRLLRLLSAARCWSSAASFHVLSFCN